MLVVCVSAERDPVGMDAPLPVGSASAEVSYATASPPLNSRAPSGNCSNGGSRAFLASEIRSLLAAPIGPLFLQVAPDLNYYFECLVAQLSVSLDRFYASPTGTVKIWSSSIMPCGEKNKSFNHVRARLLSRRCFLLSNRDILRGRHHEAVRTRISLDEKENWSSL